MLDLHTEGLPYYHDDLAVVTHLYAKPVIMEAIRQCGQIANGSRDSAGLSERLGSAVNLLKAARLAKARANAKSKDESARTPLVTALWQWLIALIGAFMPSGRRYVLGTTDVGRAAWVTSVSNDLSALGDDVEPVIALKKRLSGSSVKSLGIAGNARWRTVKIVDDMVRSGSSLIAAAVAYIERGAQGVYVVVTHGIFPDGAVKSLKASGVIRELWVTDSHPRALIAQEQEPEFIRLVSVAPIFAEFLLARRPDLWGK